MHTWKTYDKVLHNISKECIIKNIRLDRDFNNFIYFVLLPTDYEKYSVILPIDSKIFPPK